MAPARCGKSFGPRSDLPLKAVHAALICGSRDPRRMAPARCPKSFAPGRASHKKQCTPLPLWEPRSAANGASSVREELRPEVGPPTKSSARRSHCGSRALAANGASSVSENASPRGRASHKKQCTPPSFVGAATRGERRQLCARKSFAPRSDLPLKAVHAAPIVGAATRGERRQLCARKSFAPGRASHKKSSAHRST